jgi:copper homeostasis protein
MSKVLEICIDSLASARGAIAGGADRLELCSALAVGGLTPYVALLRQIRAESDIPVRCLMRPRAGDFLYEAEEIEMMAMQMEALRSAGANGFVIGCLTPEGNLDRKAMEPLLRAADGLGLTLHRCIDVSCDPVRTYLDAKALGFDTVLTSGAQSSCRLGMETIGKLLKLRDEIGGPEVLIGAGVSAAVITDFRAAFPQARAFHMSGKTDVESGMIFRREGVPMGLPGLDEWHIPLTDAEKVRAARRALDSAV